MRSRSAGSVVSLYLRWSARSSSRDGRGLAAATTSSVAVPGTSVVPSGCQVLDHAESDVSGPRLDLRPEVVHEAPDHLVGESLELSVDLYHRHRRTHLEMSVVGDEVHVHHQGAIGREVIQLEVGRTIEVLGGRNGAVARLSEGDRQLIEIHETEPELASQRRRHTFRNGYERRRRRDLQLCQIALRHVSLLGFLAI